MFTIQFRRLIAGCALVALVGCSTATTTNKAADEAAKPAIATATTVAQTEPTPVVQGAAQTAASIPAGQAASTAEIYPGTGRFLAGSGNRKEAETSVGEDGGITLNFINADIKDIAKAVLGDYLKLNYEIAGNAQGTVTIQTSQPLQRSQILPVLEQTLRLNGLALIHSNGVYKVMPLADGHNAGGAVQMAGRRGDQPQGYGLEVVPLRYISAAEMAKLIAPLAPTQGIVHADSGRNLLIIEGTEEERKTLLDDIALFDADWLSGMSFALYTPTYTDAEELTKELNQILGGINSPIADLVKLIPIDRLNAVLAISPQTRYLEQLKAWVTRLDRPGQGSDKRIFVYHVQNGRAGDLAATLIRVLGGTSGGASGELAASPSENGAPLPEQSMNQTGSPGLPSLPAQGGGASEHADVSVAGLHGMNITADETNNALVIYASPQEFAGIEAALHQLDAAPRQVFLEAAIAEVTLTNDLKYGVQYFFQPSGHHSIVLSDTKTAAIASALPGFSYVFTGGSDIKVILDALSDITRVKVLSSPQLLVLNNQTATLQVGDQVPIVTQQAVSTVTTGAPIVNSVQYQATGVILRVTPRVNRGGVVMMDITQEVSNVTTTTSSDINSPTIQQRKIASTVAIQDGETVALGGLISDSRTRFRNGIPYLQEVPLLGNLFRDTENTDTRTELMVLITPHVVDNVEKARAITDELRRKLPALQPIFDEAK